MAVPYCTGVILRSPGSAHGNGPALLAGNDPEFDIPARSVDGARVLVGEVKWSTTRRKALKVVIQPATSQLGCDTGIGSRPVRVMFVPEAHACRMATASICWMHKPCWAYR